MKEIKFRAWIGDEDSWDDDAQEFKKYFMTYDLAFEEFAPINDLLAGVKHLMQYTGLKDKNGKEIYEGDIGRYRACGEPDRVRQVFYEEAHASFRLGPDEYWESDRIYPGQVEVIGNIYENPYLLEAK